MKPRSKKILLIVSITLFLIILIVFVSVFSNNYWPYLFGLDSWKVYASGNLTSGVGGFDLNGTALTFGKIGANSTLTRSIMFTNSYDFPVLVLIKSEGGISKFLTYAPEVFVDMNSTKLIRISFVGSDRYPQGFYEGHVKFKVVPAV